MSRDEYQAFVARNCAASARNALVAAENAVAAEIRRNGSASARTTKALEKAKAEAAKYEAKA